MLHKSYLKKIVNENIHKLLVNEINNKSYVCETRETQYSIWKKFYDKFEKKGVKKINNYPFCKRFGITAYKTQMDENECYETMSEFAALDSSATLESFESGENVIFFYSNPIHLFKKMKRMNIHEELVEIEAQACINVNHEMAHGIILFLEENEELQQLIKANIDNMPNTRTLLYNADEEDVCEEFGEMMCSNITRIKHSLLDDALNEILNLLK